VAPGNGESEAERVSALKASAWDGRVAAYRESPTHREGDDLDLVVAWCEAAPGVTALDVAAGGGHVARRLRELGCTVTTCDAAAGMEPDVVCAAESLPFDDDAVDVVVCRLAAHHFDDAGAAVREMARVSRRLVVIEDGLHVDERVEEAERLRDPTHVRSYTRDAWTRLLADARLEVLCEAALPKRHPMEHWLSCTGCVGEVARCVRDLLRHVTEPGGDVWVDSKLVVKAVKLRDG